MAATWRVTETKDKYKITYSGDLQEALEKAENDLKKYMNDKDLEKWVWIKKKAEAAIKANERAIKRAQIFIGAAKEELKKQDEKKD